MEKFMADVLGKRLLITVDGGSDFLLSVEGNVEMITDRNCFIGDDSFHMELGDLNKFTKENNMWIVNISREITLYVTPLDKIR